MLVNSVAYFFTSFICGCWVLFNCGLGLLVLLGVVLVVVWIACCGCRIVLAA